MVETLPGMPDREPRPVEHPDAPPHERVTESNLYHSAYAGLFPDVAAGAQAHDPLKAGDIIKVADDPHEAAIKQAAEDLKQGKWSEATTKWFHDLFNDLGKTEQSKLGKTNQQPTRDTYQQAINDIYGELGKYETSINDEAQKFGSQYQLNLVPNKFNPNQTSFYYAIRGPGINDNETAQTIRSDKTSPTAVKVGDMKWLPGKASPI
ncbi:MAG TPA: hypothetical protein VKJ65_05090 [Phycisphaerae bacterium]|nr:hypothetical protein [Phycisphaerae bacterium]